VAGGITSDLFGGFEDVDPRPDPNPNLLDYDTLFRAVGNTFRTFRAVDRDLVRSIWEGITRVFDNEYRQLEQINASKNINTVPTYIRKDWLQYELEYDYLGTPHAHVLQQVVTTGGLPTDLNGKYYVDLLHFYQEDAFQLWIDGKEVLPNLDPFSLTNVPALGGSTLTGSRLWFDSDLSIGTVLVIHGLRQQERLSFTGDGTTATFSFGNAVDINSATVYLNDVQIGEGTVRFVGSKVILTGGVSVGDTFRITDGTNSYGVTATSPTQTFNVGFIPNRETAKVYLNGIEIQHGFTLESSRISFLVAPRVGTTISVVGTVIRTHSHEEISFTLPSPTDTLTLPADVEPFTLDAGGDMDGFFPVLVFVDGLLVPPSALSFTSSTIVVLPGVVPAGTQVDMWWAVDAGRVAHVHDLQTIQVTAPETTFVHGGQYDVGDPIMVTVDGVLQVNNDDYRLVGLRGQTIIFTSAVPASAIVHITGQRFQHTWRATTATFPKRLVAAESIQNGIDYPTIVMVPRVDGEGDFEILDGVLYTPLKIDAPWFKNADIDEDTVYNNFGSLLEYRQASSETYTRIVRALFAAYTAGSQVYTLENFSRLILNTPFAQESGKVLSVVADSTGDHVVTIRELDGTETAYRVPAIMTVDVIPGQAVRRYQSLAAGVQIHDSVTSPDWYDVFPFLIYIGDQFSSTFEAGRVLDRGVPATYKGDGSYVSATHRISDPLLDADKLEGLRKGDRIEYTIGATTYVDYIDQIDEISKEILLGTDPTTVVAVVPPGNATVDSYTISFRRFPRYDENFFMDQPEKPYIDYINQQMYELLKQFVFLVEVTAELVTDPEAMETLRLLLNTGKRAVTTYVFFSFLGGDALSSLDGRDGMHENVSLNMQDDVTFTTTPAYLIFGQTTLSTGGAHPTTGGYVAPSPVP